MYKVNSVLLLIVLHLFVHCSNATFKSQSFMKKLNTGGTCTKGFGIRGECFNNGSDLSSLSFPGDTKDLLNNLILPILMKVTASAEVCYGDYSGDSLASGAGSLGNLGCSSFPFSTDSNYGILAASANNVVCGTPQDVSMCAAFDDCGTFALAINGGTAQCAATYSTGIAAIVSPLADAISAITFGFSPQRKFTQSFNVAYKNGDSVSTKQVTTKGHFLFGLNLTFPHDWLKINGKNLGDYVSFELNTVFLVDFGTSTSIVTSLISSIKNATKASGQTLMNSVLKQGAELTAYLDGQLVLGLDDMTDSLFQDISVSAQATLLITQGGSGSNSGLTAGMYIYFTSDIVSNLLDALYGVYDHFGSILGQIGISKPSISGADLSLGLFITPDAAGFQFDFAGISFKCIFNFSSSKGSCQFSDKFFTAIANAGKWVIKKASKLFDETGDEIVKVAKEVGKFAVNTAKAVADKTASLAKQTTQAVTSAANTVANTAKSTAKTVTKALKKW